jgi:hypothetical protein
MHSQVLDFPKPPGGFGMLRYVGVEEPERWKKQNEGERKNN